MNSTVFCKIYVRKSQIHTKSYCTYQYAYKLIKQVGNLNRITIVILLYINITFVL